MKLENATVTKATRDYTVNVSGQKLNTKQTLKC